MLINKNFLIAASVSLLLNEINAATISNGAPATSTSTAAAPAESWGKPNTKIAWQNDYPLGATNPFPKEEWIALVKEDASLNIPRNILTPEGEIKNADATGKNTYCNWTWDGCVKETDIVSCEDTSVWGTSFDDGPYEITRELLAYLKSIDRKVTFFVVGAQVVTWPEILKEAYDQGHEIGIHTWNHPELTTISNEMIIGQLKWTETAIKEVLGVTPRLMRPPRGDIDDRVRYIVNQLGYTPAMWSVDSQDWRITAGGQTEEGLLGNVTQWVNGLSSLTRGGNSLMHDLNNITVGAALKALPILHPNVKISPVGVCAGWKNASYVETYEANSDAKTTKGSDSKATVAVAKADASGSVKSASVEESGAITTRIFNPAVLLVSAAAALGFMSL